MKQEKFSVSVDNRSFRYGDGCFETMHMRNGKILLADLHFERLLSSAEKLFFTANKKFTAEKLTKCIAALADDNGHEKAARIRLTIHRGDGGLYDDVSNEPQFIIQTWKLKHEIGLNENGLDIGIYKDAKKQIDIFSSLKTNNYQPYVLAALWAKQNKLNDALVMNVDNRIADATIANVFIVKNGVIQTPSLQEGCVAGVMRRFIIQSCKKEGIPIEEGWVTDEEVESASEIFLTNAVSGIRWVKSLGNNSFQNSVSQLLFTRFIGPLFNS